MIDGIYSEHIHDIYEDSARRNLRQRLLEDEQHRAFGRMQGYDLCQGELPDFFKLMTDLDADVYWRHEFEERAIWALTSTQDAIVEFIVTYLRTREPSVSLFSSLWSMGIVPLNVVTKIMATRQIDGTYVLRTGYDKILPIIKDDIKRQKTQAYEHMHTETTMGFWSERFTAVSWLLAQCSS